MGMGMLRGFLAIALVLLLTACNVAGVEPNKALVERAIALQLEQAQTELSQQLRLDTPTEIRIKHLTITEQTPLTIQNLPSYRVKGNCDFTVNLPKRSVTQRQIPFEVYLQRQKEGKTWRRAFLKTNDNGDSFWASQRIPSKTF
jgi:hypothetical protein